MWHAGDWGALDNFEYFIDSNKVRGVYGNIDGRQIRAIYPKDEIFTIEGLKVYITHIGGYPGKYSKGVKRTLRNENIQLFISGHSHICKVMKDKDLGLYHFNPGAIGNKGFHQKRTMIRIRLDCGNIFDVRVLEYERIYK